MNIETLKEIVKNSKSMREVLRKLNKKFAGGTYSYYTSLCKKYNIDTSHFLGKHWSKNKNSGKKKNKSEILILRFSGSRQKHYLLKRSMIESNVKYVCNICNLEPIWNNNPLTLDVDHINKNWLDDRLENLRFLCPNCHSQFSRNLRSDD